MGFFLGSPGLSLQTKKFGANLTRDPLGASIGRGEGLEKSVTGGKLKPRGGLKIQLAGQPTCGWAVGKQ